MGGILFIQMCYILSWAEVITSRMKQKYIIEFTHSGSNSKDIDYIATIQGGHLGINKTTEKISSRYYWCNIKRGWNKFHSHMQKMPESQQVHTDENTH